MQQRHLICNAHIDPLWQWDLAEGVSTMLSTFRSAVRLLDEFDYVFCHNEAIVYRYVEEYAPDLFEEICALVKKGKWHIMGGWFLQPDCNMPSGESLVRQALRGQSYFRERFGQVPTTAINFDPFGHSAGLVQIIKKCGQNGYLFMRPYQEEMPLPAEQFIWRGLDGSEIKAARCDTYSSNLGKSAEEILSRASAQNEPVGIVLWGVGNHGGGPSRKDLSDIEKDVLPSNKYEFLHSTPEEFFEKVHPTAIYDKSLHITMPGCYTAMSPIKQLHARLEIAFFMAEKMSALAYARGALDAYPKDALCRAEEDLLLSEFHDILPGSGVPTVEDAGKTLLRHGIAEAERLQMRAFYALTQDEPAAKEGEYPILVFNPHPYTLEENVECEFMLSAQNRSDEVVSKITLLDSEGNALPYQIVKEESNIAIDWRKHIVFRAHLAPFSVRRYSVYVEFVPIEQKNCTTELVFDNGRKQVEIDAKTGLLKSYRIDGTEYVHDGFSLLHFDTNQDVWAMAPDQQHLGSGVPQPFCLSQKPSGVFEGMKSVQVIEDGEIYRGIEAFFETGASRARIAYKIYKNTDDIDIDVTLFCSEKGKLVKLCVPISARGTLIGQTVFGTEHLFSDGRENVAQRFVAVEREGKCLALLNRGTYGSSFFDGVLSMTLVRSTAYCAHPIEGRPLIDERRFIPQIDQGEHHFSFRLTLCDRDMLARKTGAYVQKPYALNVFPVPTKRAPLSPFSISLSDPAITLEAMKMTEGKGALLFRLHNSTEHPVSCVFSVNEASVSLAFGRFEVKTLLIEKGIFTESEQLLI